MITITYSDTLATIALLVAISCAYYTKAQSKYTRLAFLDNRRAYLASNHKSYYKKLMDVQNDLEPDLKLLSYKAGEVLSSIVSICDTYDKSRGTARYLRHLVHESAEMIFYSFNGQLGWQAGQNIMYRFYQFKNCEMDLEPSKHYSGNEGFRRALYLAYCNDHNNFQEAELLKDIYFCNLVAQAKSRFDEKRTQELLLLIHEKIKEFLEFYADLRPRLIEASDYLKSLLKEGEMEHFKLSESYSIHNAISYRQATFNTLYHLLFPKINQEIARHISTPASYVIYTCALLHAIQGFDSWGWKYKD